MKLKKPTDDASGDFETVLVLQGGGSLGAYECGVYKTLQKHKIKFDIVAGTSIGGINAAIITAGKDDNPAKNLEEFWLTLAERTTPSFLSEEIRAFLSSMQASIYGNPKAFAPIWFTPTLLNFFSLPYLYDITPLKNTLKEYTDFGKLKDPKNPRLIVTSTDIQSGKSCIFDSRRNTIDAEHVIASAGYPFYGISWTQIDNRYLWDGTLLSNTPLTEVIDASPRQDKKVYIVNLFPHRQDEIPKNMIESWHRARDIMHTDKTDHTVRMSRVISRQLALIKEMHDIIESSNLNKDKEKFSLLELEYHRLACERGAIIRQIIRITRKEDVHFLFEDADFSIATIKQLIRNGEVDAENALAGKDKTANAKISSHKKDTKY
ncbi:MAG: patatin-like phospholipase family protein [Candidatus Nitrosotenuis sp.]|nr:MAG: patatin-like phospholipase family protein [Candidatus Nitrosotenuis sp.]